MYIRFYLPYETVNIRLAKVITWCPGIIVTGNVRLTLKYGKDWVMV